MTVKNILDFIVCISFQAKLGKLRCTPTKNIGCRDTYTVFIKGKELYSCPNKSCGNRYRVRYP